MKDHFLELRKELKTLRGKDLFVKRGVELCLVPNVKIPMKFKMRMLVYPFLFLIICASFVVYAR